MPEYIARKKQGKSFREIVLTHLDKILDLSTKEFRGGYWDKKIQGDAIEEIYIPDSRKQIIQAIDFFYYILKPMFNEEAKKEYSEIKKKLSDNLKRYESSKQIESDYEIFIVNKLKYTIQIFELLNQLLNDKEYLTGEDSFVDEQYSDEGEDKEDD